MEMRPQSAKNKGRKLQQWMCQQIIKELGVACEDCRSCSMGASGEDVQLSKSARKKFPYSVECKNREQVNVWQSYRQAEANAPRATEPLLCIKRNKSKPLVVVDAEHFVGLIRRLNGHFEPLPPTLSVSTLRVFLSEPSVKPMPMP